MAINCVIVLAVSIINSIVHATNVYLENNYEATIKYITAAPISQPTEYPLNNTVRSNSLGEVEDLKKTGLSIRTTGKGSGYGLSPYTNLDYYLAQIIMEETKHPDSDAVIKIGPSYNVYWSITIYWIPKNVSTETVSMREEKKVEQKNTKTKMPLTITTQPNMPLAMKNATSLSTYSLATEFNPTLFYNNGELQKNWFTHALIVAKKDPLLKKKNLINTVQKSAMGVVKKLKIINIDKEDITTFMQQL